MSEGGMRKSEVGMRNGQLSIAGSRWSVVSSQKTSSFEIRNSSFLTAGYSSCPHPALSLRERSSYGYAAFYVRHSKFVTRNSLPPSAFCPLPSALFPLPAARCPLPARAAFTLIELLVTIAIIGILASMLLVATYQAQETAKAADTRATIAKINNLIMQKWEGYQTRRVPIRIKPGTTLQNAAKYRLDALHDLMRLELPDRWSDIDDGPITYSVGGDSTSPLIARPSVSSAYKRFYDSIKGTTAFQKEGPQFEGAECLYLIVVNTEGGREMLRASEIGDTDSDGANEILDGWGRPIRFLRWAPGFVSEVQPGGSDPDPFDPRHVYSPTYRLTPLIYSAGPDKIFDIYSGPSDLRYADAAVNNNPYMTPSSGTKVGTAQDLPGENADTSLNSVDNITNHLLGTR